MSLGIGILRSPSKLHATGIQFSLMVLVHQMTQWFLVFVIPRALNYKLKMMNTLMHNKPLLAEGLFFLKRKFLFLYLILNSSLLLGQQFNIGDQDGSALTDSRLQDFMRELRNDFRKYNPTHIGKKIKGSPYFNPSFSLGSIKHKEEIIAKTLYLRYNAFNDEVEIGLNPHQEKAEEAVLKRNDIECTIGNESYRYLPFKDKANRNNLGYLIPFFEKESVKFFKRKKKNYLEETIPRTSLERGFPPRFVDEIQYYLSIEDSTPYYLGNDIREVVKNFPNDFKNTAKTKNIRLKNIKDEDDLHHLLTQILQ